MIENPVYGSVRSRPAMPFDVAEVSSAPALSGVVAPGTGLQSGRFDCWVVQCLPQQRRKPPLRLAWCAARFDSSERWGSRERLDAPESGFLVVARRSSPIGAFVPEARHSDVGRAVLKAVSQER